jgi:hypothetical protein
MQLSQEVVMRILAAAAVAALAFGSVSWAQPRGAAVGAQVEALVTIVAVDKKQRTVVLRGPRGNTAEVQVPPDAKNFDQVKQGDVFRVRYAEAVALAIVPKGGEPDKGDSTKVKLAEKGANPGGVAVRTRYISGRIEAIDYQNRYVAIRGPKQQTVALKAADDIKLEELNPADRITIAYTQAIMAEMVPAPAKPKPKAAPKKKE